MLRYSLCVDGDDTVLMRLLILTQLLVGSTIGCQCIDGEWSSVNTFLVRTTFRHVCKFSVSKLFHYLLPSIIVIDRHTVTF